MRRFLKGFIYAKNGIAKAVKEERNLRIHTVTGAIVLFLSCFYGFTKIEYIFLLIMIAGVISLELVNSAIERSVDNPLDCHYNSAGAAKDMAAGAVLVFSIACAIGGVILFWNVAVFQKIYIIAIQNPLISVLCVLLSACAYAWAFKSRKEDK